jgi:DHA2 family multidrug resistance protein
MSASLSRGAGLDGAGLDGDIPVSRYGGTELPRSAAGPHNPWLIAIIVSIATFMEVLDTTIANVSLRHIAGSLAASQDESTWVLTSYLVSNAVVLPVSGWMSNVLGRKRFYMICVAIFTTASLLCALSTSLGFMIAMRVLQGAGGGGLAPVEQSMLADTFPTRMRAQVFALYGFTVILAPAIGPVLGGFLTDNLSWHYVFLINLPFGLLSLVLVQIFVHEPKALVAERARLLRDGLRIDYVGFAMVVLGFGALQVVLDRFQEDDGFASFFILAMTVIAAVALIFLVLWEWDHPQPVVNIRLLRVPAFAIANVILFLIGFMLISTTQLLPQLTQSLMGYDAATAGLSLGLGSCITLLVMPFAGILTGRVIQPRWLLAVSLCVSAAALLHMSHLDLEMSFWNVSWARAYQAMALPFLFIPVSAVSFVGVPANRSSEASAISNLTRNLGGSCGVSLASALLAWRTQFHHARLTEHVTATTDLHGRSLAQVAHVIQTQAQLLSYLDVFHVLGITALVIMPIVLLLPGTSKGSAAAGH